MYTMMPDKDYAQERVKYTRVWNIPAYRNACHSLTLWNGRRHLFPKSHLMHRCLDIGCGTGLLFATWCAMGFDAWAFDIADNCLSPEARIWQHKFRSGTLWEMQWAEPFDFGICTDVMEHVPPRRVEASLHCIADSCREVLFKIAHSESHPWIDREHPLHLTIQPVDWWLNVMRRISGEAKLLGTTRRSSFEDSLVRWRP